MAVCLGEGLRARLKMRMAVMSVISRSRSLVVLRQPGPVEGSWRLHMLMLLALTWFLGLAAYSLYRGERPPPAGVLAINLGPVVVVEPGTETPFPIQLGPLERVPKGSWLQIEGLPVRAALSEGYVRKPGTWVVPLSGLATLRFKAPPTTGARTEIAIALMSADGIRLAQARSVLVMPSSNDPVLCAPGVQTTLPVSEAPTEPAAVWAWPGGKREAQSVMRWGEEALARGSVGAARSIYKYAAEQMGWPDAALALAASFDPHELARLAPLVTPDPEEARLWYARAQELANARINFYLTRLGPPKPRPTARR